MSIARRRFLALAGATVAGGILSGCGLPGKSHIIELSFTTGDPPAAIGALVQQFASVHPGVRVQMAPSTADSATNIEAAIITGTAPDVFWGTDPAPLLSKALCVNLTPLADGRTISDFSSAQLYAFRAGNGLYMLPQSNTPAAYVVREDIFAHMGISIPEATWTSADLAKVWLQLRVPEQRVGGRLPWSPTSTFYLTGWGGSLTAPNNTMRCNLNTAPDIACGTWMWDRFWQDNSAAGLQGQASWATLDNGSLVMDVVTSANVARYATSASYPWTVLPFPRWPSGSATSTGTPFYAIPVTSPNRDLAWELLEYVTSTQWEQATLRQGVSPARKSQWGAFIAFLQGQAPALKHLPLTAAFATPVLDGWAYPPETFRFQSAALSVLDAAWASLFGKDSKISIASGFAQAANAVDAAEASAAKEG